MNVLLQDIGLRPENPGTILNNVNKIKSKLRNQSFLAFSELREFTGIVLLAA